MIKTLVIDDERLARRELISLLGEFSKIEIVGEAINVDDALEKIEALHPDVLFLDIQMPGKNGFELLETLVEVPKVIFTTAYDEYALKAFEVNAMDYLLKPIVKERLEECVQKIINADQLESAQSRENSHRLGLSDQVFVKDGEKCWFVKLSDVRLFESDGNYIKVYFDHFKPMIHKSLNALDKRLDERAFFRASRKHIINLSWVESIESWFNGGLLVKMKGGEKVEVSRRQASKFKDMMSL